ncbi:MAG TPA: hypothetical protein VLA99_05200, partial [Nitrospiraceae bacterium]|nr:hypothetical protein [Nitrospiraceae bacterium]
ARSSRRRIIRGASGGCQTEDNTRRQPEHNPDISTLGRRGHFYLGLTPASDLQEPGFRLTASPGLAKVTRFLSLS